MNTPEPTERKWNQSSSPHAPPPTGETVALLRESETRFRALFERSADAMSLFDPVAGVFVESNEAVVRQTRAPSREALGNASPASISPERQPDGRLSSEKAAEMARIALERGTHRFEWVTRRFDGTEMWIDVVLTDMSTPTRPLLLTVSREITPQKQVEAELRQLAATLEQRVLERTAELSASQARLLTLVENAPEAIVVFDGETARFEMVNENAVRLFRRPRHELLSLCPADISPPFQPDGQPSDQAARDRIREALAGGMPVFDWLHRDPEGRTFTAEVRLVRLPAEGRSLVRASIIETTERRRKDLTQRAVYEISEAVHAVADLPSLYARIHGIVRGLMPADNFFIALYDPGTELITFPYYVDVMSSDPPEPRGISTGLTGLVLQTGRSVLADRAFAERSRRENDRVVVESLGGASYVESGRPAAVWLGAPLMIQGKVIGVMALQDYQNEHAYGAQEQQLLGFVAGQVAVAIERKQAEEQLRKSEEKFKMLFELSPLGISRIDWRGNFLQVNSAFAAIVGRTRDEILRLSYWDITPREYEARELAVLEGVRRDGHFGPFEKEYVHRDGHRVPIVLHAVLVRAPDGEEQLWGIVEDVTERRRAEKALRESESNFRALFESSSQGVMLHDEHAFIKVNAAAARIFGQRPETMVGRHPRDFSAPVQPDGEPSAQAAERHIRACLTHGQARFEWLSRRADGSDVPLDVVLTSISISGRGIIQAMVTDISERKRAEAELLKSLAREKELGQLRTSFVSMVSHEFRTPLGVIMSSAQILADYFDRLAPSERLEHLASIAKNTRSMSHLMEEVLVLSRVDSGRMILEPAEVDLDTLSRRIRAEVLSATGHINPIHLSMALARPSVLADVRLLRHILTNLLANAVKYSPPGSPVEFTVLQDGEQAGFRIRDRGIGILEADREWLFEAFHRGRNVGDRPGTGLGLTIVKRCVELHGGSVDFVAPPDGGTQFTVTLRLPPAAPADNGGA